MVAFTVRDFGGEVPRRAPRLLPDNMSTSATNVDLQSGPLKGLPQPQPIVDLSGTKPWEVRRAYRIPGPTPSDADFWLALPSEFSSVVPSPLANDTLHRYYWTNPPGQPNAGAFWNTYSDLVYGNPDWNMGFIPVDPGITLIAHASGGTTTLPQIERSYCFTWVDAYGQESSPSQPSAVVAGYADSAWTVTGFPGAPPAPVAGKNYPIPHTIRIYRTITGASGQATFYFVSDMSATATIFADAFLTDDQIVNNNTLQSTSWTSPPDGLDGLIAMPGGMLIGFTDNTIHFCEPERPNAWPAGYDQSMMYPIQGLAVWQQSLVVLTKGFPSTGAGTSPSQFTFAQVHAPEPCVSRGSIVTDLAGVYYSSINGLISLNYFGMQNQTLTNVTREIWIKRFRGDQLVACRHRTQYLAINGTGTGFLIDYAEQRLGIVELSPFVNVIAVWNDDHTGEAYIIAEGRVYLWDAMDTPPMTYVWQSREFYFPMPQSLGACQISSEPAIAQPAPADIVPQPACGIPGGIDLPPGVNAVFRLMVGPSQQVIHEQWLREPREIFRLPSGRKAFNYQFQIIAKVMIHSIELASTMRELKKI